jgi:hypothetical protein
MDFKYPEPRPSLFGLFRKRSQKSCNIAPMDLETLRHAMTRPWV